MAQRPDRPLGQEWHRPHSKVDSFLGSLRTALRGFAALVLSVGAQAQAEERGRFGQINILYWQAPSTLNPYLSGGTKDVEAASLTLEPLARYNSAGEMVPWLVDEIPTPENGGVSDDLRQISWRLKPGLVWSDGSAVSSADVAFTWRYCTAEGAGCAQADAFDGIAGIATPDARTAVITFEAPRPFPYGAFVGAQTPILQERQFAACLGAAAPGCTSANFAPIGTGPFQVGEFRANDVVVFDANPNYREPGKPGFRRVVLKGGGSATDAARTVLETGEFDYAWNLQLPPKLLTSMVERGRGQAVSAFGTMVERIVVNFTDPDPKLGKERSTLQHAHPALGDLAVRQALSLAIDRQTMLDVGYGLSGRLTCNLLPAPAIYASSANQACLVQDQGRARALLEAAGWRDMDGDGVREKDGQRLRLLLQTSTNAVRQDFQAMLKFWWAEVGIETELRNIDASVFFGSDAASPDTFQKFYADLQMFAGTFAGTDPEAYLAGWACDGAPAPHTQWQGPNIGRWCRAEYDHLIGELSRTGGIEARAAIARQMNDLLIQDVAVIPLIDRGRVSAHSNTLGGIDLNAWDSELWNIADWHRIYEDR